MLILPPSHGVSKITRCVVPPLTVLFFFSVPMYLPTLTKSGLNPTGRLSVSMDSGGFVEPVAFTAIESLSAIFAARLPLDVARFSRHLSCAHFSYL
jgi:hypothetical protein